MVSIIVPSYNHAKFLEKRFETIFNQTFQDFEVLVFDDASTDGSDKILRKIGANPKVKSVEFNENNCGNPYQQWIKGIIKAKGEYIWIAESDDYSDEYFLEKSINQLLTNPDLGLTFCDSELIDFDRSILPKNQDFFKSHGIFQIYKLYGKEFINKYLGENCVILNVSSVLFRKEALVNSDFIKKKFRYRYYGDWYIYIELLLKWNVIYINERLNFFRKVVSSHSSNPLTFNHLIETLQIQNFIWDKLPNLLIYNKKIDHIYYDFFDLATNKSESFKIKFYSALWILRHDRFVLRRIFIFLYHKTKSMI